MLFAKGNPFDVIHRYVIITYATNKFISIITNYPANVITFSIAKSDHC